jgi:cytochrome c peroxidase
VDRRLSGDDTVACIDCHSMQHGAGDGVGVASLPTRRRGEAGALTVYERAGYELFKGYGCISCHQGANLGGNMLERLGVLRDYFAAHGPDDTADLGRFNVTGLERDRYVFRVPTLRNVALTAPYFHDGSAATLEDAVDIMGEYQLGRRIEPGDVDLIVQFLGTLTGRYSEPRP